MDRTIEHKVQFNISNGFQMFILSTNKPESDQYVKDLILAKCKSYQNSGKAFSPSDVILDICAENGWEYEPTEERMIVITENELSDVH